MGLDQYAHLRDQKDMSFNAYDDNYTPETDGFYWRKHARLQKFMSVKYDEQNPDVNTDDQSGLPGLGFNGGPVVIDKKIVSDLEEAINNGYFDYFTEDGFFWGQQFQEEAAEEYKEQDQRFVKWCKEMIDEGKIPEYHCSW